MFTGSCPQVYIAASTVTSLAAEENSFPLNFLVSFFLRIQSSNFFLLCITISSLAEMKVRISMHIDLLCKGLNAHLVAIA